MLPEATVTPLLRPSTVPLRPGPGRGQSPGTRAQLAGEGSQAAYRLASEGVAYREVCQLQQVQRPG